jgi:hypothetical protein
MHILEFKAGPAELAQSAKRMASRQQAFQVVDFGCTRSGPEILLPDTPKDLLTMNRHVSWGIDPDPHLSALDFDDGDFDFIANSDLFPNLPGQDEHSALPGDGMNDGLSPICE